MLILLLHYCYITILLLIPPADLSLNTASLPSPQTVMEHLVPAVSDTLQKLPEAALSVVTVT